MSKSDIENGRLDGGKGNNDKIEAKKMGNAKESMWEYR